LCEGEYFMTDTPHNGFKRKSLSGAGTNEGGATTIVAEVKHVKEAPDKGDRRLEVKLNDRDARNSKMLIDAPVQIARKVTPGKTYEFELKDSPFRGGSTSCFQNMKEIKRTDTRPTEVSTR